MSVVVALKDSPVPYDRLAVGAVLSDPRGRRYMKIMLGGLFCWALSVPASKGAYTDTQMRDLVEDDWEVWL